VCMRGLLVTFWHEQQGSSSVDPMIQAACGAGKAVSCNVLRHQAPGMQGTSCAPFVWDLPSFGYQGSSPSHSKHLC
jgi:hypothetical protein